MATILSLSKFYKLLFIGTIIALLAGCAQKVVTFNGQTITDKKLVEAINRLDFVDKRIADITRFLISLDKSGALPDGVLHSYRDTMRAPVVKAIDEMKELLKVAVQHPNTTTISNVETSLIIVESVLKAASNFAMEYGW